MQAFLGRFFAVEQKRHFSFVWEERERGESNAKMHLVLRPVVFALRQGTAIFARKASKIHRSYSENRKFRTSKNDGRLFWEELSQRLSSFERKMIAAPGEAIVRSCKAL